MRSGKYDKYLLPWKETHREKIKYEREYLVYNADLIIGVQPPILVYTRKQFGQWEWIEFFYPDKAYKTAQEAMDAVDNKLRQKGYTLLTKEQAERLQPLV